jgi:peptide deformylase
MKILARTQFGNPILRATAKKVAVEDMSSKRIQQLIARMRHTLINKKLGVGIAAPQVGQGLALAVIAIRPTAHRPHVKKFDLVIINPEITAGIGRKQAMWEGCISSGPEKTGLFAKVPRYKEVKLRYYDEQGKLHHKHFKSLAAQVIQHEVDHLNGVLFVDHVKDPTTYMTYAEYKKRIVKKKQPR